MSIQKPLHLGTKRLLCSQLNIGFCHLHWFLALEEKARGDLGMSVPTCRGPPAVPVLMRQRDLSGMGGKSTLGMSQGTEEGGASCSASTLGPNEFPSGMMVVEILGS